ncbi:3-hydroxyacyl-ACP dehydratase FabZ family protein [Clostridium thailandense]|uniref:Beta-hydroxyacyl-ACP dehydratase n=1 Tax=Clostridium thailandense TaxID=2794346 RepID=A0A949TML5_9CLOT|nr:3-hydroxyacyl-ACP dehydratase FabZ family protein [Clostridium thailandense]MBV7275160.1 beta-hydroxyacyl-ACP dehydratase [Clostridium thailandense]MCH5137828.1 beta-hydroxyacyl-ACP dehydratase [Clostridiaceae bacterium UIB06]
MSDIEALIPHRHPFLFVDEILSADEDKTIGIKTYDESFAFFQECMPKQKIVPNVILIESMGQCGGAGIKKSGIGSDALYGFAVMENVRFFDTVKFGETVRMIIKNINISNRAIKQSGTALCNDKVVAEATWMCARL